MAMYQHYLGIGYSSFLFYIPLIVIGQMTFVTLFSAIFLNTFIKNIKKHLIEKKNQKSSSISDIFKKFRTAWTSMASGLLQKAEKPKIDKSVKSFAESKSIIKKLPTTRERSTVKRLASLKNKFKSSSNLKKKRDVLFNQSFRNQLPSSKKEISRNDTLVSNHQRSFKNLDILSLSRDAEKEFIGGYYQSFCQKIIENRYFENFMGFITVISLILFMINTPISDPNSLEIIACEVMEKIFIGFYILEIVLTIKARGFTKYFLFYIRESFFNLFNAINVIISIGSLFEDKYQSRVCETMKVVRIFRLLSSRSYSFHEMNLITKALMNSLNNILKLLVFFTIFLFVFSLFGMKYLKGYLYSCQFSDGTDIPIVTKTDCFDYGGDWINADYSYDNILNSFFTLFVISTTEGWSLLM
jgi:hypothetical protein